MNNAAKSQVRNMFMLAAFIVLTATVLSGCLQTMSKCVKGNCVDGNGMLISPNGMIYEGQFVDGQSQGQGTRSGPNLHTCVGTWDKALLEGLATCTKKDDNYIGNYSRGRLQGLGLWYRDNGSAIQRGIFNQGRLVTAMAEDDFNRQFLATYKTSPPNAKASVSQDQRLLDEIKRKTAQLAENNAASKKDQRKQVERRQLEAELKQLNAKRAESQKAPLAQVSKEPLISQQVPVVQEAMQLETERKQVEEERRRLESADVEKRLAEEQARVQQEKKALEETRLKTASSQPVRLKIRRTALIIGNGNYANMTPLKNPTNDARDMASTLAGFGFDVTLLLDANKRQMKEAVDNFQRSLEKGGMGLFYYAGHGIQVAGENYLVPVNTEVKSEADVAYDCLNAGLVLKKMEEAKNDPNIIILDACRNNPFGRAFSRGTAVGLAKMDAPAGAIIAYATAPGRTANDGSGKNGLYTKHLLANITNSQLSVGDIFKRVRIGVAAESGQVQIPWEASSLFDRFYIHD